MAVTARLHRGRAMLTADSTCTLYLQLSKIVNYYLVLGAF